MTNRNPQRVVTLNYIALVIAFALTALAIYDLSIGERATSVWIAIVCWPIVFVASALQIARARRA